MIKNTCRTITLLVLLIASLAVVDPIRAEEQTSLDRETIKHQGRKAMHMSTREELWDAVILVIMQKAVIESITPEAGLLSAPPYAILIEGDERSSVVYAYFMGNSIAKDINIDSADKVFILDVLLTQISTQRESASYLRAGGRWAFLR